MPLVLFVALYTVVTGGPFLWVAMMSLRTTPEIFKDPTRCPSPAHWEQVRRRLDQVELRHLLLEQHDRRRRCRRAGDRRSARWPRIASPATVSAATGSSASSSSTGLILPPQLLILSLFQILLDIHLYNTLTGLILVYVATHLAMTVYILEGFFAQIPQDLFDAARMDGYSRSSRSSGASRCRSARPRSSPRSTLNFIVLWNEFLFAVVLLTDDDKRTLPLGIMHFMGSHQLDVGMVATGLMIAMLPIILIYAFFSETMIKGMTAGAVR